MKLGTIAYDNQIYNLDYMTAEEVGNVLCVIEKKKKKMIEEMKNARID